MHLGDLIHQYESQLFVIHVLKAMVVLVRLYYMAYVTGVTTGARGTGHPPFSNFLFTSNFIENKFVNRKLEKKSGVVSPCHERLLVSI
jgi:hypothetical protein